MANPMAVATPAQNAPKDAAPVIAVPFVRAAQEHIEPFMDVIQQQQANSSALAPVDVPAYGFMRGIFVEITTTLSAGTGGVARADFPFNALRDIGLYDVNSAPIVGPIDGYDLFVINKYGGYRKATINPKRQPDFASTAASGAITALYYIPVEVNGRDALGALANQNAASSYKLRLSLAGSGETHSAAPTTLPTYRVRAWLDAWTQPNPTDLRGNPQAVTPPANNTTSYWSKQVFNVGSGQQTIKMQRVGNLIRNAVFIFRDGTGVRNKTNFPPAFQIYWDTRLLKEYAPQVWRSQMSQRYFLDGVDDAVAGLDTGVYVEDYCHEFDGSAGFEMRDGWLPTVPNTRYEVQANFGAAGTLTVLTNDVSPAGEVFT